MKWVSWMSLGLLLVGCGEEAVDLNGDGQPDAPGSVTQIAPVHPEASVSGYVYDAVTGAGLDGVSVAVHTGGQSATATSAAGLVALERLPAGGTALVTLTAEGYLAVRMPITLPDDAGDFPSANNHASFGQIGLFPTAPLSSTVFDSGLIGKEGVTVSLNLPYSHLRDNRVQGAITLQATSGAEGELRFENGPALSKIGALTAVHGGIATIHAHADNLGRGETIQENFHELAEMGRLPIFVRQNNSLLHTIRSGYSLRMVHANIADLVQRIEHVVPMPVAQPIRLLFDRAINPATLSTKLVDEDGDNEITLQPEFAAGGRLISLVPALGNFTPGAEYNLRIRAESSDNASSYWLGSANLLTESDHTAPFSEEEDYVLEMDDWQDNDEDGAIDGGDDLILNADLPIGRRRNGGTSGLNSALAQFAFVAPLNVDESVFGETDFTVNGSPSYPTIHFEEPFPGSGFLASGYTTRLRLRLPDAASFNANMRVTIRIKLIFDNPQLLNADNQVRMPNGTPLTSYTVRVELP